jgi:Sulfatase-modifying factor enzyme 1
MSIWSQGGTGLEFVLVPSGSFQMGSPTDEVDRRDDEFQHQVSLNPFLIARTECTQGPWSKFASAAGLAGETFEGSAQLPIIGFNPAEVDAWCRAGTTSTWTMGAKKGDMVRFANVGSAECPESWIKMGITESWHDGYGTVPAEVASFAGHTRSAYRLNVGTGVSPDGNHGFGFRPALDLR